MRAALTGCSRIVRRTLTGIASVAALVTPLASTLILRVLVRRSRARATGMGTALTAGRSSELRRTVGALALRATPRVRGALPIAIAIPFMTRTDVVLTAEGPIATPI